MTKTPFLQRLQTGSPLLGDGAMGTMLLRHGKTLHACFDAMNLEEPETVQHVHHEYLKAGADLLETNTFGANRYKLLPHGLADRVVAINQAGVAAAQAAVQAAGRADVYIAGSIGPLGVRLKPYGRLHPAEARAAFAEQIRALDQAGVDLLVLETFSDVLEETEALAAAQAVAPHLPVVCHMTFGPDDRTPLGDLPANVARELSKAGADVIGVNCGGGPEQLSRILQLMHQAQPEAVLSAMPNAGFPEIVGGRTMYPATEDYFAEYALIFKALGARIIGGCCGTTPTHIAAMRTALDDRTLAQPHIQVLETLGEEGQEVPERPTDLARKLAAGRFIITVEMQPPRSFVPQKLLAAARLLQDAGADMLDVTDSPTARMRMSPWAMCHLLQTQVGIETVLHFPTRGRNLLRVQGDLLAAHTLGLRNLFVVMGDPTKIGDYPEAMDNYDVAPSALIGIIKGRMNKGVDQAGNSIGQPTTFTVGCAVNMFAQDLDREIALLRKKIEQGADFALGQPAFEPERIPLFLKRYEEIVGEPLRLPVLMGMLPLYNLKHAQYLHNEIPGISLPEAIMRRIKQAGEDAPQEGVRIAQELLRHMRSMVQGAYIIPAFGHYELAAEVIDALV